jgi:hypothetical protein
MHPISALDNESDEVYYMQAEQQFLVYYRERTTL